ncbi:unnamed protein product [Rotaria sp. Silwood2]|nr:unnamed protein product [Rotaria sp. Silwood2]
MWKSLNELKQALNDQISFSFQLDEINKYFYHEQIPLSWRSYTPQTKESLGNCIEHFQRRNQQYEKWIHDGKYFPVKLLNFL